ncbi:hypothetical protein MRB53_023895 [Persea americana]|uniref:Uncharacterized protein n=1 Tax=Persea americana TaxID=3435 RepID=A0ACC2LBV7_PERAE|nr:hypothetical protein MRB53_023895 [Persea americana]
MKQHPRGGSGLAGSRHEGEEDDRRRGGKAMTELCFPLFAEEERRRGRQSAVGPAVTSPFLSKQEGEEEDVAWGGAYMRWGKSKMGKI